MVFEVVSKSRVFYLHKSLVSWVLKYSVINCKLFSSMKELGTDLPSSVCASMIDEVPHDLPPIKVGVNQKKSSSAAAVQFTPEIEKKYVHRVYDAIAPHFSATRFAKWPKVSGFLNSLPPGSLILDSGCGNGKYLGLNPMCYFIGCDISSPLIKICSERGHEVLVADAVNLPYRTGYGDAAISIAVLHHLSTEERRRKAVEELIRAVKKGGVVLITVWAREQEDRSLVNKWTPLNERYLEEWVGPSSPQMPSSPRVRTPSSALSLKTIPEIEENGNKEQVNESFDKSSSIKLADDSLASSCEQGSDNQQEFFIPWHLPYHRAEINGASANALASGLAKKDNKKHALVYNRYYHVFGEGELERLVSGVSNAVVIDRFFDKSNWCIILQKTS